MTPFESLLNLQTFAQSNMAVSGEQQKQEQEWTGVVFDVADTDMVIPMLGVVEIIPVPPTMTKVPGTKSWLVGLVNLRGMLMTVADLNGFLFGSNLTISDSKQRLIVVNMNDFLVGLLVPAVFGMKHFRERDEKTEIPAIHQEIMTYVTHAYARDDASYSLFDIQKLLHDENFLNASL